VGSNNIRQGRTGSGWGRARADRFLVVVFVAFDNPDALLAQNLVIAASLYRISQYAIGMIVLWTPKKLSLDSNQGLDIVLDSRIKKLAIANPRHAPYGCAAEESLRYYGLWDKVHGKLVFGENVSQTAQFAQAGAANAAIIALSIALSPDLKKMGNYWIIPTESYKKLDQVYAVLPRGEHKSDVKTFLRFLDGEKSKRIFSNYGFILPQSK